MLLTLVSPMNERMLDVMEMEIAFCHCLYSVIYNILMEENNSEEKEEEAYIPTTES